MKIKPTTPESFDGEKLDFKAMFEKSKLFEGWKKPPCRLPRKLKKKLKKRPLVSIDLDMLSNISGPITSEKVAELMCQQGVLVRNSFVAIPRHCKRI